MALNNGVRKVNDHSYVIGQGKVQALVEFGDTTTVYDTTAGSKSASAPVTKTAGYDIALWGRNNQRPQEILQLVRNNHAKGQLLKTERDFLLGSGISLFTKKIEGGKKIISHIEDPEIQDWMDSININQYISSLAWQQVYFWSLPTLCDIDPKTRKISAIQSLDHIQFRAETIQKGQIANAYLHPNWKNVVQKDIILKPIFDPNYHKLEDFTKSHGSFVYWAKEDVPGQYYYPTPAWWGTENWTKAASLIPLYHVAGFTNGWNLKYHIVVPFDYMLKLTGGSEDPKLIQEQKEILANELDKWLSGAANNGKAFISYSVQDTFGKEAAGWKIEALDNKMTDKAYVDLDKQANINQASGHGIDPALAGVDTGGKLGGSGSEKRISYQLHLALRTPQPREMLLRFLNKVAIPLNGWKDKNIFFGIEDIDITTLDNNPTGQSSVVNKSMK